MSQIWDDARLGLQYETGPVGSFPESTDAVMILIRPASLCPKNVHLSLLPPSAGTIAHRPLRAVLLGCAAYDGGAHRMLGTPTTNFNE